MSAPSVPSTIEAVTVYRSGALVTRVADLEMSTVGELPANVELGGLPLALADASLRLEVEAEGDTPLATEVRVKLAVPESDPTLPPPDDAELLAAELRLAKLERQLSDCMTATTRLSSLEPLARPIPEEGKAPAPSPTAPRLGLIEFRSKRLGELHASAEKLRSDVRSARERIDTLQERKRVASAQRNARPHELRKVARVRLEPGGEQPPASRVRVRVRYFVPGARWAPAYTLRLDAGLRGGSFELRALVGQNTGEDWNGVALTLSTASPQQWTELPELKAIRIGRAQPEPMPRGWRPPPPGAAELYADYDRDLERAAPPPPPQPAVPKAAAAHEAWASDPLAGLAVDEDLMLSEDGPAPPADASLAFHQARARRAPPAPPGAPEPMPPPPPPMGAPVPRPAAAAPAQTRSGRLSTVVGSAVGGVPSAFGAGTAGGDDADARRAPQPQPQGLMAGKSLLDYGRLRMPGADDPHRGTLRRIRVQVAYAELVAEELSVPWAVEAMRRLESEARGIESGPAPARCRWPHSEAGFDYAFKSDAPLDLDSDGSFHNLPIAVAPLEARPRYVSVPRESQDVFRVVALRNPLEAPVLPGPADVYVDEKFSLTSDVELTPINGRIELGLGVEQAIKIARNVEFTEDTSGLIKRQHELVHEIRIDLANHLPHPALVEVRERLPIPAADSEDDIEINVEATSPQWEEYEQKPEELEGGRKWTVEVAAGGEQTLTAKWTATIPSNHELTGGNRRET